MSLLRIYAPLGDAPLRCAWVLINGRQSAPGEGTLAQLPRGADLVQLVIPAAQVLLTRRSPLSSARAQSTPARTRACAWTCSEVSSACLDQVLCEASIAAAAIAARATTPMASTRATPR